GFDPRARRRRVDILHPPVGVRHLHPMIIRDHPVTGGCRVGQRMSRRRQRDGRKQRDEYETREHAVSFLPQRAEPLFYGQPLLTLAAGPMALVQMPAVASMDPTMRFPAVPRMRRFPMAAYPDMT